MLKIENLTKKYGNITAVDNLTLEIGHGEFFGLLGPNGAGKTTTVRMISTLTPLTSGKIIVDNNNMDRNLSAVKRKLGIVPQHNNLESELTGRENLILHGKLYNMSRTEIKSRIEELFEFIELNDRADHTVNTYSGGMKRRLMIARALMHKPELLLLDEPTVGLDATTRRKMLDLLKDLKTKGLSVLLTTHYIEEAQVLCDRIGMIHNGKLVELDTSSNLIKKVGEFTVEYFKDGETKEDFFNTREEALAHARKLDGETRIRQSNLEDVFLVLTKRRVL